ncbi:hypothetical protein [Mycoplasmopsis gallopavonis]|uniref:Uncharacterized protein n=1 Tax=Mycoplasmopsis gallopavonis TaxID=76629 RepID=A0A449AZP4_9BACT|nr:hypothetical protein [Mycoplasmopsis gallopavonis]RIV16727.1 hypothetical protein D1113_01235 [Mycoplasmopsis gallopavonis]VEU72967.1 Uncharacterised protein [Mycoplasmopsis gallopavonis]
MQDLIKNLETVNSIANTWIWVSLLIIVFFALLGGLAGYLANWKWFIAQVIITFLFVITCLSLTIIFNKSQTFFAQIFNIDEERFKEAISYGYKIAAGMVALMITSAIFGFINMIVFLVLVLRSVTKRKYIKITRRLVNLFFGAAFGATFAGASTSWIAVLASKNHATGFMKFSSWLYSAGQAKIQDGALPAVIEILKEYEKNKPLFDKILSGERLNQTELENLSQSFLRFLEKIEQVVDVNEEFVTKLLNQINYKEKINFEESKNYIETKLNEVIEENSINLNNSNAKEQLTNAFATKIKNELQNAQVAGQWIDERAEKIDQWVKVTAQIYQNLNQKTQEKVSKLIFGTIVKEFDVKALNYIDFNQLITNLSN